jgi:catechol 2,3-dioxygenase-like lactoylglutathione lyase family enzyme
MARELYMVGLTVSDMDRSIAFYRRLGIALPESGYNPHHIEAKMNGGLTFFLDDRPVHRGDPAEAAEKGTYRVLLEFYLDSPAAVEAQYNELIGLGYHSYRAPFVTSFGMVFALVDDPDGNTILFSADAPPATEG